MSQYRDIKADFKDILLPEHEDWEECRVQDVSITSDGRFTQLSIQVYVTSGKIPREFKVYIR